MSDFIPHWKSPPPPGDDSILRCDGVGGYERGDAIGKEGLGNALDGLIYGNGTEKMETSEDEIDSLPELSEDNFSGESPPQSSLSSLSMDQQGMRDVNTGTSPSGHQETLAKDAGLSIDPMVQYGNDTICQSGPITLGGVVMKRRDSDPPIQLPKRRTGSRLTSGSSSGSSLKGFRPRRTQMEMKSMTKEEKRELKKSQGRANFKNSLQKKKNKKASLEEHSKDLDVELRDGLESLKQLEDAYREKYPDFIARKNNVAHLIEKKNQGRREKLEKEVRKLETKLETIAKERTRKGTLKTSNASAKCRTNQKLEIALLELKVHQQETEIEQMDMIMDHLKEALGVKSMEGEDNQQLLTGFFQSPESISLQCHGDTNTGNYLNFNRNSEDVLNSVPVDYYQEIFDNRMNSTGIPLEEQSAGFHPCDDFSMNHEQYAATSVLQSVHHMDAMDHNFQNFAGFNFAESRTEPLEPDLQGQFNQPERIPNRDPDSPSMLERYVNTDKSPAQWVAEADIKSIGHPYGTHEVFNDCFWMEPSDTQVPSATTELPPISTIFTNSEQIRKARPGINFAGIGTKEFPRNRIETFGWNQPPGFPLNHTMVSTAGTSYPYSGATDQQYFASSSGMDCFAHHCIGNSAVMPTDGYSNTAESLAKITDNSVYSPDHFFGTGLDRMVNYPYGDYSTADFNGQGSTSDKYSDAGMGGL
ncbi:hypothetical protein B9Z55_001565 [Caenorhabditis nigoni]|uniref:Uncharacterized protein n=1 Tax=Caenorhabditis nigoni TaxID=1611254 RepID=A0A2G5VGB8_9PELO|nr:hypothetical protein B9Z55_001565 [Caenorhabditis nigoni]